MHTKVGFVHEVYNLSLKYDCLDVWLRISRPKENKLNSIRKSVEAFHLTRDMKKCCASQCMYTSLILNTNLKVHKRYTFEDFFKRLGQFPDTMGRCKFIFALLDRCNFERECPMCRERHFDVLEHTLHGCPKARHLRVLLKMKLELFNIPGNIDITNKAELFTLAIRKRLYRRVLCEYLCNLYR